VLIQIDVSAANLGLAFPVDHALVGGGGEVMGRLVEELEVAGHNPVATSSPWAAGGDADWSASEVGRSAEVPILPQRAIAELGRVAPADAFFTCDAGENRLFMLHHFQTRAAGTFLQPAASGGMGYAIPAALAAKVVHPDRAAVAVCGDGGFAMTMNGLMTAVEMDLPIIVMVLNNSVLGWVLHGQPRPIASRFAPFDHAAMARSMGCEGVRVERPDELGDALAAAFAVADRPTVVEVLSSAEQTYRTVASPLAETAE
jgi:acetolactate synthase-1/2/3 large subunit